MSCATGNLEVSARQCILLALRSKDSKEGRRGVEFAAKGKPSACGNGKDWIHIDHIVNARLVTRLLRLHCTIQCSVP